MWQKILDEEPVKRGRKPTVADSLVMEQIELGKSYSEIQTMFGISRMQISRIKKRNQISGQLTVKQSYDLAVLKELDEEFESLKSLLEWKAVKQSKHYNNLLRHLGRINDWGRQHD